MGKSEVQTMPLQRPEAKHICVPSLPSAFKNLLANNLTGSSEHSEEENEAESSENGPEDIEMFTDQVAGHSDKAIGMLKQGGVVLKPIIKKECGEREIHLYESLQNTVDRTLVELKEFVPKFFGTKVVPINGKEYDFIVLEDLTKNFKEPCIMDIKIGRRTWDPKATYEKIMDQEAKYHECKRDLGFCIPGFQLYKVYNGQLVRYGKEFGKSLNKERAEDAIRTFLNSENGSSFCRRLIVQFLAALWRIQAWARNQRLLRLYATSILLVYDARRLREHVTHIKIKSPLKLSRKESLYRPMSLAVGLNKDPERCPTGFSGQLTKEGPILKAATSPNKIMNLEVPFCVNNNNSWQKSIHTLKRTHSFQNNYDKDVQNKKQTYAYLLDDLCTDQKSECWAVAKMIDFAHVYPAENCDIDKNYLDGIESLVRLFEDFLIESE